MHLYVIRHAHAVEAEDDPARPLSKRGRKQTRALADFLGATGAFRPVEIWHSPLARARETAAGLAAGLKPGMPLKEVDGLRGGDDPRMVAARIDALHEPVAIVGHDPHLTALITLLLSGTTEPPAIVLKKCAAVRLDRMDDRWAMRWHVAPEILA